MKLFLDTSNVQAIKKWLDTGLIDGITTNPSLLSKHVGNPKDAIMEIAKLLPNGQISVEVTEKDPKAVYAQARKIADLGPNIVVKIPCHADYYAVIKRLVDEGIALNITLVFTLIQGLMMSKMGVTMISPFIGRWDDLDMDGSQLLYDLREMIDRYDYETEILAASLRHVRHIHVAIDAGADIATLPPELFEKVISHQLTDSGMQGFDNDWKKLGISQFP